MLDFSEGIGKYYKRIKRAPLYYFFKRKNIAHFRWERVGDMFIDDFFNYKRATVRQKLWAYKRGFVSERIASYSLNDSNCKNYMSDFDFYKRKMYKNRRFVYWLDDKLTTWFILQPFREYLPIHYYSIENEKIRHLYSDESTIRNDVDGILELIHRKKELAFKQTIGGGGIGFFKASFKDQQFYLDDKLILKSDLENLIVGLNGYIITEYVYSHNRLRNIYDKTPNGIRLVTIYDEEEGAKLVGAYIRFGTSFTGYVDNIEAGGIFCGIRLDSGEIFKSLMHKGDQIIEIDRHPDTNMKIEGCVPNWPMIAEKIIEISNYLNNTPFLTYDLVSTDTGFKILEINSHGKLVHLQCFYPFYANPYSKKLFF